MQPANNLDQCLDNRVSKLGMLKNLARNKRVIGIVLLICCLGIATGIYMYHGSVSTHQNKNSATEAITNVPTTTSQIDSINSSLKNQFNSEQTAYKSMDTNVTSALNSPNENVQQ